MIFSYAIDKNMINVNDENELEKWLGKANHLFDIIRKRTVWYDCDQAGMSNALIEKYTEIRKSFNDDLQISMLESFWMKNLWNSFHLEKNCCQCHHPNDCKITANIKSLNDSLKRKLDFYITYNSNAEIDNMQKVDINNFYSSPVYNSSKLSEYKEDNPVDNQVGAQRLFDNFYSIINNCEDEIVIIDRNVFERWNDNYNHGLIQFIDVINNINPNLVLTIITRHQDHHRDDVNKSAYDILRYLKDAIKDQPIKIKIKLCAKKNSKFEHARYILFDEKIGAKIERGLDSFIHSTQGDRVIINYSSVEEVIEIRTRALSTLIKDGDFKQFSNKE